MKKQQKLLFSSEKGFSLEKYLTGHQISCFFQKFIYNFVIPISKRGIPFFVTFR